MNKQNKPSTSMKKKMALTAGALSAIALTPAANADVICVDGDVAISIFDGDGFSVGWDIDGMNGDDFSFSLRSSFFSSFSTFGFSYNFYARIDMQSADGRGLVENSNGVAPLMTGAQVGPTLSPGYGWVNNVSRSVFRTDQFSTARYSYYGSITQSTAQGGQNFGVDFDTDFGTNLVGFRFEDGAGELHYGYAEMEFFSGGLEINRWYYESDPDTALRIPGVPEPNSLALLGLGAGGLLTLRRRRKETAA